MDINKNLDKITWWRKYLLLFTFLILAIYDGITTFIFVSILGVSHEANPIGRILMTEIGLTPTIILMMCVMSICWIILLRSYISDFVKPNFIIDILLLKFSVVSIFLIFINGWGVYTAITSL